MSFDREQWDLRILERMVASRANRAPDLRLVAQAAVKAEALTGDPAWDTFLTYVAAIVEEQQGIYSGNIGRLADPRTVDQNEMMQAKIAAAECRAAIAIAERIMALPRAIIAEGKNAQEAIGPDAAA